MADHVVQQLGYFRLIWAIPKGGFAEASADESFSQMTQAANRKPIQRISRRSVIVGLGLTGLAAISGGLAWFIRSHKTPVGTILYIYRGHSDAVTSVAWSPNGEQIASGSLDQTAQVWDATDGSHIYIYHQRPDPVIIIPSVPPFDHADVVSVMWSPNGKRVASGGGLYDTTYGMGWIGGTVQVWDAIDGSHVYTYPGHDSGGDTVTSVAWSPNGKRIASAGWDTTVQVWDAIDGNHVYTYHGHSSTVYAVAWAPNGKHIASASEDGTVQVWDAVDGNHVYTYHGHSDIVNTVAWAPNGGPNIFPRQNSL